MGNRSERRARAVFAALAALCAAGAAANPTGGVPQAGTVSIQQTGNLLQVTNSPSAIINWQSFSINANEITRFVQQSSASAVLNRVTGVKSHGVTTIDPSVILGSLQSNGRVFLINSSGIVFGPGSRIDVAGLVATSLDISNSDFVSGRLRFKDTGGAGAVTNNGAITTPAGGNVYLVGSAVTNGGIITSPSGEVVLAAGSAVELVNPGTPDLRVLVTATDNQAVNLGQILAASGRIGIFAGIVRQGGTISADSAVTGADGSIYLKSTKETHVESGSVTTANGSTDGTVEVKSGGSSTSDSLASGGSGEVSGGGGHIEIEAGDVTHVDGVVEARGRGADPASDLLGHDVVNPATQVVAGATQLVVLQQTQAATTTFTLAGPAAPIGRKKAGAPVCGDGSPLR